MWINTELDLLHYICIAAGVAFFAGQLVLVGVAIGRALWKKD